jgi:hypothetical protein
MGARAAPPHDHNCSACEVRRLASSRIVCSACSMRDVYGRLHAWGPKLCPCFTAMSLARATFRRDSKSTRLVLERTALPLGAVDVLARDFAKYAAWLLQLNSDGAPNLRHFINAVEMGQIAVNRRRDLRPGY